MADFYFPNAFSANPIQSFIDGKLAAQERVRKERVRQIELWYKYQDLQMRKARHDAALAKTKADTERLREMGELNKRLYGSPSANPYAQYYGGSRPTSAASGVLDNRRQINVDGAIVSNPSYGKPLADPFVARYGQPMRLGGPRGYPTDPGFDEFGLPIGESSEPPGGVTADGSPVVMTYEQAAKLYGWTDGDDTGDINARRDAYFAAGGKVGGGRIPQPDDPFANPPTRQPRPTRDRSSDLSRDLGQLFAPAPARKPQRYDPFNSANDEFMLNFYGGY